MPKWIIREPTNIARVIRRLGTPEKRRYFALLKDFKGSTDPSQFAQEEETVRGVKIFVSRLNDSYRVKYTVFPKDNIIVILSVGDHKETGLRGG